MNTYLPVFVMIISVPNSLNLSQSSLVSRRQWIEAISSHPLPDDVRTGHVEAGERAPEDEHLESGRSIGDVWVLPLPLIELDAPGDIRFGPACGPTEDVFATSFSERIQVKLFTTSISSFCWTSNNCQTWEFFSRKLLFGTTSPRMPFKKRYYCRTGIDFPRGRSWSDHDKECYYVSSSKHGHKN